MFKNKGNLLFLIPILIYAFLSFRLLTVSPPIWPDESIYSNVIENLTKENRLGFDLLSDPAAGYKEHSLWNPPLFFYQYVPWFKLFGSSIESQRSLAVVFGLGTIIVFILLLKELFKNRIVPQFLLTSLLVLSPIFHRGTRISRPEVFVLFFAILSTYFLIRAIESKRKQNSMYFVAGFVAALAFQEHYNGVYAVIGHFIFFAFALKQKLTSVKNVLSYSFGYFIPSFIWLIFILPHWKLLLYQIDLSSYPRSLVPGWYETVYRQKEIKLGSIFISQILASLFFVARTMHLIFLKRGKLIKKYVPIMAILAIGWWIVVQGKTHYYSIYISPFIVLALGSLLYRKDYYINNAIKQLSILLYIILISFYVVLTIDILKLTETSSASYEKFAMQVAQEIPEDSTVYLSAIPDPYFALKDSHKQIYQMPAIPIDNHVHLNMLTESDYIVFNGEFNSHIMGTFLSDYIKLNTKDTTEINGENGYRLIIIRLIPPEERFLGAEYKELFD